VIRSTPRPFVSTSVTLLAVGATTGGDGHNRTISDVAPHPRAPRIFHGMRWLGQAERAFELMCARATTRFAHGSLLSEKGDIQRCVAESAAEIQAARLMTFEDARAMDTGSEARVEIALIMCREARYARIYDGPDEVHRIGRRAPAAPGSDRGGTLGVTKPG
jgi:hypothetical protein